ncbi:MAG TPA: hypothetical protein VIH63_12475 [Xanthobacteraceae bacterium]
MVEVGRIENRRRIARNGERRVWVGEIVDAKWIEAISDLTRTKCRDFSCSHGRRLLAIGRKNAISPLSRPISDTPCKFEILRERCPFLAQSGHYTTEFQCPAFGGKADIAAKLLTKNEARRIAANIAKLPELVPHVLTPALAHLHGAPLVVSILDR